jgi:hypothetical protein
MRNDVPMLGTSSFPIPHLWLEEIIRIIIIFVYLVKVTITITIISRTYRKPDFLFLEIKVGLMVSILAG